MIKSVRNLTRLLGKVGIKELVHNDEIRRMLHIMPVRPRPPAGWQVYYGYSLKESKDFTENYLKRIGEEGL